MKKAIASVVGVWLLAAVVVVWLLKVVASGCLGQASTGSRITVEVGDARMKTTTSPIRLVIGTARWLEMPPVAQ